MPRKRLLKKKPKGTQFVYAKRRYRLPGGPPKRRKGKRRGKGSR